MSYQVDLSLRELASRFSKETHPDTMFDDLLTTFVHLKAEGIKSITLNLPTKMPSKRQRVLMTIVDICIRLNLTLYVRYSDGVLQGVMWRTEKKEEESND